MEKDAEHRNPGGGERVASARSPRVFYAPRENVAPEGELVALATIYEFVLRCHDSKRAVHGDEVEEGTGHGDA